MRTKWANDYFFKKFKISPISTHYSFLKHFYLDSLPQNEYYHVTLKDFE